MGGKSRKTGNISLALIRRIKEGGNLPRAGKGRGTKDPAPQRGTGFDLALDEGKR